MHLLLQQLPALLGVLLGAISTYAVTVAAERRRWRREQSVRWDDRRVSAYIEYAHAIKKVISAAVSLAAQRGINPDESLASGVEPADLAAAENERTIKWEAVLQLGTEEAVIAGRQWHESVFRLQWIAYGRPTDMTWDEAVEATGRARRRFYEVTRRDIGMAASKAPESYEWQTGWRVREKSAGGAASNKTG
jgi:hypothetical protein